MAKIKRFYLLIAALIYSRSYALNAATVDCTSIYGITQAKACYRHWHTKYENRKFTYGDWQAAEFSETDYATCQSWSPDFIGGEESEYAPSAICNELYEDELASFCCETAGSTHYKCTDIVQDYKYDYVNTCDQIAFMNCQDSQEAEMISEWEEAITRSEEFTSGCYDAQYLDSRGYEPESSCLDPWDGYDEDGNVNYNAECCNIDRDRTVSTDCYTMTSDPERCWLWYKGKIQCEEYEEDPECGSGTYLSAGNCIACPEYEYDDGSTAGDFIWSDKPAYNENACYVPKNIELWDDSGTFVFNWDCHYTGS